MEKFQTRVFFDSYIDLEVEAGARWESALTARDIACGMSKDELLNKLNLSYAFTEVGDGDTLPKFEPAKEHYEIS
jgi:hypothetical protein